MTLIALLLKLLLLKAWKWTINSCCCCCLFSLSGGINWFEKTWISCTSLPVCQSAQDLRIFSNKRSLFWISENDWFSTSRIVLLLLECWHYLIETWCLIHLTYKEWTHDLLNSLFIHIYNNKALTHQIKVWKWIALMYLLSFWIRCFTSGETWAVRTSKEAPSLSGSSTRIVEPSPWGGSWLLQLLDT